MGSIPGSGRSPGERNVNPLQYSCLKNPTDRGAWWATVHRVRKSLTQLKRLSMHALCPYSIKETMDSNPNEWSWLCANKTLFKKQIAEQICPRRHICQLLSYQSCSLLHPQCLEKYLAMQDRKKDTIKFRNLKN